MTVTIEDIERRRPAPLTPEERKRVEALIADAYVIIKAELGKSADKLIDRPIVDQYVIRLVTRQLDNPLSLSHESIGEYSYSRSAGSVAGLFLTRDECRELRRLLGLAAAGTIRTPLGITADDVCRLTPITFPPEAPYAPEIDVPDADGHPRGN